MILKNTRLLCGSTGPGTMGTRRRHEREALVHRLEDLPALVQGVAPGRVVVGDARVQDESWLRPATAIGSNWNEPNLAKNPRTASMPPSSERAGESR